MPHQETLLRLPQVIAATGVKRSTLYAKMRVGTFPKPIWLGSPHAVAWLQSEVNQWIAETIAASRGTRDQAADG
jgi:prophage regulatory protein